MITLDRFFNNFSFHAIDVNRISIDECIKMLIDGSFDDMFDKQRIVDYLGKLAAKFETEFYGRQFCKHCGSLNVRKISHGRRYFCNDCKRTFVEFAVIPSHFPDWVICNIAQDLVKGKKVSDIYKSLVTQKSIEERHGNLRAKIPDEKSIYDIAERLATLLWKFHLLMVLLIGGIMSKRIMIDDLYALEQRKRKTKQKTLDGAVTNIIKLRRKWRKRFRKIPSFFPVVIYDPDRCFLPAIHVAKHRDRPNYHYACSQAVMMLKRYPCEVRGDKLKAMIEAVEKVFPRSIVKHVFQKLKPWEKGELTKIERKIRDIRKAIPKRRKYRSARFVSSIAKLVIINENYLEPRGKLGGKPAALAIGIPYPFKSYNWELFLSWVKFVVYRLPSILKVGLKVIPGTPLAPDGT